MKFLSKASLAPIIALAGTFLISPTGYSWGSQGHAAIGLVAEKRLSPTAKAHVESILGNDDLSSIASWMDEVIGASKGFGPLAGSREAHEFGKEFPHSNTWHYVDLPLGEQQYADNDHFSRKDDVVHQINHAVEVLEGKSTVVSPKIALYMLVHFVGDLHQPLHVACGYYDLSDPAHPKLITDPKLAVGKQSDAGANLLKFSPKRWDELHGYWDIVLPEKVIGGSQDIPALGQKIAADIRGDEWATSGDHHGWAEQWATESIIAARQAYAGVELGAADVEDGKLRGIHVTLPATYDATAVPLAERRLAQAAYHLAEILNAIDWPAEYPGKS